jgi:cytochrome P450
LLRPHADGALSEAEVFWFFLLLLLAGHETTTNLLGNLLLALVANPDQWLALRTDATTASSERASPVWSTSC